MSQRLEALAGPDRRAECAKHDAAIDEAERRLVDGVFDRRINMTRALTDVVAARESARQFCESCEEDARAVMRGKQ